MKRKRKDKKELGDSQKNIECKTKVYYIPVHHHVAKSIQKIHDKAEHHGYKTPYQDAYRKRIIDQIMRTASSTRNSSTSNIPFP